MLSYSCSFNKESSQSSTGDKIDVAAKEDSDAWADDDNKEAQELRKENQQLRQTLDEKTNELNQQKKEPNHDKAINQLLSRSNPGTGKINDLITIRNQYGNYLSPEQRTWLNGIIDAYNHYQFYAGSSGILLGSYTWGTLKSAYYNKLNI